MTPAQVSAALFASPLGTDAVLIGRWEIVTVRGDFRRPGAEADLGVGMWGTKPVFEYVTSDADFMSSGDRVEIGEVAYTVAGEPHVQPETGTTVLTLREVES